MTTKRGLTLGILGAAACAAATTLPQGARACGPEPYLGMICMTAAVYCPRGYAEANGQLLAIADYNALYAIMGINYGGDGRTNFGLPDLRGRTAVGLGTGPGAPGIQQGEKRGQVSVVQTVAHMPTHSHQAKFVPLGGGGGTLPGTGTVDVVPGAGTGTNTPDPSTVYHLGGVGGRASDGPYTGDAPGPGSAKVAGVSVEVDASGLIIGGSVNVENNGGGLPLPTIPPQIGIRFCVATEGLFPPRT